MMPPPTTSNRIRFGAFEADPKSGELFKQGLRVKLQEQPFKVLAILLERPGEVVTREELRTRLWREDTFVDFDQSLNKDINKIREALRDSADNPRFIETLPKRGYRLIAAVEIVPNDWRAQYRAGSTSPRQPPQASPARRKRRIEALILGAPGILASVLTSFLLMRPQQSPRAFDVLKLVRLTTSGRVGEAVISPEGKYLAYVEEDSGKESIWLRQVATAGRFRLVPPQEMIGRLSFSPDGNHLYYVLFDRGQLTGVLYRVPVSGGESKKVLEGLDSAVSFSPEGRRMVFLRGNLGEGGFHIVVANTDGTAEKKLTGRRTPGYLGYPDWSPDGRLIVFAAGASFQKNLLGTKEDGSEVALSPHTWPELGRVLWLRNGKGLIMTAQEEPLGFCQVWLLEYPSGRMHRITNDLDDYGNEGRAHEILSVTADSTSLVTVQTARVSNVWIVSAGDLSNAKQVTFARNDNITGLAWKPDGKIVYGSSAGGMPDIWMMGNDGSNPRQLTIEPSAEVQPTVSPDNRYIVFVSERAGIPHLWKIDADGSKPTQLTNGSGELFPQFSPDGKWVVYTREDPRLSIWKVPIEGGNSMRLTDKFAQHPSFSPDGKWIACAYLDDAVKRWKLAVMPVEGGLPTRLFDMPHGAWSAGIRWTPDGDAIAYVLDHGGVSNLWLQPTTGGPPKQLTQFHSDRIFSFAWSADGTQLALARGTTSSDAVLIKNFQ